jgi:hypothetical protein
MVPVLSLMEDERTFNNLAFMKSKLHNQLTTHLDLCVCMFTHNFYTLSNVLYNATIVTCKEICIITM